MPSVCDTCPLNDPEVCPMPDSSECEKSAKEADNA